jgi:hypothetical protein
MFVKSCRPKPAQLLEQKPISGYLRTLSGVKLLERMWTERSWHSSRYYPGSFMEGLAKTINGFRMVIVPGNFRT